MATDAPLKIKLGCSICGHDELAPRLVSEKYEYETDEGPLVVETKDVPVQYCERCGESYLGPIAVRMHDEAVCRALGLLTSSEIRSVRERLGRTPAEFARLVGATEEEVSLWERGRLLLDRRTNLFLRTLDGSPEAVRVLERVTGLAIPEETPRRDQPPVRSIQYDEDDEESRGDSQGVRPRGVRVDDPTAANQNGPESR